MYSIMYYITKDKFRGFQRANADLGYIKGQASSTNSGNTLMHVCVCKHKHMCICIYTLAFFLQNGQFG